MTGFLNHLIKVGMHLATKQVVPMAVPPPPGPPSGLVLSLPFMAYLSPSTGSICCN